MAFIDWDEHMAVGITEIDEQHKRLLDLINELHDVCTSECGGNTVARAADAFTQYTRRHFAIEEQYMDSYGYPEKELHLEQHMECSLKALDFFGDHLEGINPNLGKDMLEYFKKWLLNHILKTDRRLGEFLRGEGMS